MDQKYEALFTPWKVRDVEIKNRIVLCPMGGTSLFGWFELTGCKFDKEAANFFLERAKNNVGLIIPVVITVYADRSFSFVTKTPPAAVLIKKACGIEHASGRPNKDKVANITKAQVREIAELKMPDLNAASIEAAMSMIAGTARSMGVVVVD